VLVDQSGGPLPSEPAWTHVLEVVPVITSGATAANLPAWLRSRNSISWVPGDLLAAGRVAQRAGVASERSRLFLSYVRRDTSALAEQLFDELNRQGFDVFLDRFRIAPGVDFHVKIAEELCHKAVVLVLESENIRRSPWVAHEVAFARLHQLGLVGLQLPRGRKVPEIENRWRHSLAGGELTLARLLRPAALASTVQFIRGVHFAAESWRRAALREAMSVALALHGFTDQHRREDDDIVLAANPTRHKRYAFRMACYPPSIEDFHAVAPQRSPSTRTYVVGAAKYLDQRRRANIEWISTESSIGLYDQSEIYALPRMLP
jgi:hypothetical protein